MITKKKLFSFCFILLSLTTFSQNGLCFKYKLITRNELSDTLKVFNLNGNSFNQISKVADGQITYRSLKLKDKVAENYFIYPNNSYRMIPDVQLKDYVVKVLGKEKINDFNCTKISLMTFNNGNECYLWMTDELPDYKNYLSVSVLDFKLDRLNEALAKIKLSGIPVKIAFKIPDYMTYEFISVSPLEINAGMFDLGNYTKTPSAGGAK